MSSNLPAKRHPDSAKSIAVVDLSYKEVVDGFEALDELSEQYPWIRDVVLAQNSSLAKIYQEYRAAIARNDVMTATIDAKDITIAELREETDELKRLRDLGKDQILTPRQVERRREQKVGKHKSKVYHQVAQNAQQSVKRY